MPHYCVSLYISANSCESADYCVPTAGMCIVIPSCIYVHHYVSSCYWQNRLLETFHQSANIWQKFQRGNLPKGSRILVYKAHFYPSEFLLGYLHQHVDTRWENNKMQRASIHKSACIDTNNCNACLHKSAFMSMMWQAVSQVSIQRMLLSLWLV